MVPNTCFTERRLWMERYETRQSLPAEFAGISLKVERPLTGSKRRIVLALADALISIGQTIRSTQLSACDELTRNLDKPRIA